MTICSLNVRGLSNDKKRRETFLWLKKKQFSIYFVQETHSTNESGIYCRSEWGYSTIFTEFLTARAVLSGGSFFFFKPRSHIWLAVSCSAFGLFFFLFLLVSIPEPPRMMSSSANYRPFLSSFRHIPPQEGFVKLTV